MWKKFLRDFTGQTGVKNISKQVLNSFKLAFDQDAIDNSVEQAQSFKAKSLFKPLISNVIIFFLTFDLYFHYFLHFLSYFLMGLVWLVFFLLLMGQVLFLLGVLVLLLWQ